MLMQWIRSALTCSGISLVALGLLNVGRLSCHAQDQLPERITAGVKVLYDLRTVQGDSVADLAGQGQPLQLKISKPGSVKASADGLHVLNKTLIRSEQPATDLTRTIMQSGALTVEAWIRPATATQSGPARILTLSLNGNERNLTLGQDGDKFDFRLRTTETSTNGIPSLSSKGGSASTELTHVVCTHGRGGMTRIYINGELNAERKVSGDFSKWDQRYHLGLANELTEDRPWQGSLLLAAVFSRELTAEEVRQNFKSGVPSSAAAAEMLQADLQAHFFESRIALLLSRHCLECHDAATRKGELDLSRKSLALKGGETGLALIPGKSAESLIWQLVEADQMPRDRTPLSTDEKATLKKWLDDGASWSLQVIDPAIYAHGSGAQTRFVQRLTVPEYIETVRSTLHVDISRQAREILPKDLRADGFSNTAYNLNVDLGHVEAYARLAEQIVEQVDIRTLVRKYTKSRELSDENLTKFIKPFGQIMLRGPLSASEIQTYCGVSTGVAAAGGNFEEAVAYILESMLQSPRFLYRMESQRGDGTAWPVSSYELATRLSYILWGGPPDEELLTAAEKGGLDRDGVISQTRRMLQDERAVRRSKQFITEWLNLNHVENLRPAVQRFPDWNAALADDMRQETLAFFEEIVWKQNRPLCDLLNAQVTFVTPRLAKHYGMPATGSHGRAAEDSKSAASSQTEETLLRYELQNVAARGGLLTHGSVLTVGGDDASMVTRGLFVMHELLRGVVKDPPPCVDATPVPSKPGLTQRAIAEGRLANKSCTGCHAKFETLSFGLEKFDGLGAFHDQDEYGNTLREDGTILFPGQEQPTAYRNSEEMMNLLAASDRVRESITWKVTQFAVGRPLGAEDAGVMADIHRTSQADGGTYSSLLTAIVLSDLVQLTRTEPR